MSATDTLETATIARWLAQDWNLSGATVEPHHGGMNLRTWFVTDGNASFVAKAVPIAAGGQLSAGLAVAARVEAAGIPAGAPVLNTDGGSSITRDGWTLALLTFVDGEGLTGESESDRRLIGGTLARAHVALAGLQIPDADRFHWLDPDADYLGIRPWIRPAILTALAGWERLPPWSLTWGLLHSDPAPEAFRFDAAARVCGVIDWDRGLVGPRMYDLASAVMYVGGPRRSGPLVEEYIAQGGLGRSEVERASVPLLRLRFAVQADYFARRVSTNDMTGIDDASENEKGLEDARTSPDGSEFSALGVKMDTEALRTWLDERTARHEFSGVALVWRNGEPTFTYSGGLAHRGHGVPNTEQTRFAIASVTKLVTATAALRLVDRGIVRLDQPLIEVLPPEHQPTALTSEHTLHHLLSHTSGLANYHDDEAKTWASFISCWDRIPTYHVRRPADMLPLFADLPAVSPPGSRFQYNDAGFILAGLVIEAVTGRAFADVIAEEVLQPAGMFDTGFDALDEDPPRLATGYVVDDGPPESWRTNIFNVTAVGMPDGGMITTAHDLARLVDALLGGALLSPTMTAAMMTPQGPPSDAVEQYGYGCWLVVENGEVTIIGHGGSDPGVSTEVTHHRSAATTIVVLCNMDRGSSAATKHIEEALGLADPRP